MEGWVILEKKWFANSQAEEWNKSKMELIVLYVQPNK